jgi:RNA 2',3'-cyclic 3'-phosphodiesterase
VPKKFALRAHCRQDEHPSRAARPGTPLVCAPSETWRVFCAVAIPEEVRALIAQHTAQLKNTVPDAQASWTPEQNIHLTLKFLGDTPQTRVQELSKAASRATARIESFRVSVEETGAFPRQGPPRALWIGINDPEGKLQKLYSSLEDECAKAGFQKETRSLHPHLTIARLRKLQHARALASVHKQMLFEPVEVEVAELLVMRSELGRDGSKYSVISRHPLDNK